MGIFVTELCFHILTWNVAGAHPGTIDLTDALTLKNTSYCPNSELPDVYAIGFQDISVNFPNRIVSFLWQHPWVSSTKRHLEPFRYTLVKETHMQGMLLLIFARSEHMPHIKAVATQYTRNSFGGMLGNKGAISTRMSVYGTGFIFVNSHMTAEESELRKRVEEYQRIVRQHVYNMHKYENIFSHEVVIWFGDLNFRLVTKVSPLILAKTIERGEWKSLLQYDELTLLRRNKIAFYTLHEQPIYFKPTFKYVPTLQSYDLLRRPAWTDRILYRVQMKCQSSIKMTLKPLGYKSYPMYIDSDHKPVSAEFLFSIKADVDKDNLFFDLIRQIWCYYNMQKGPFYDAGL